MRSVAFTRFIDEVIVLYAPPRRARSTQRQITQVLREFAELKIVKKTADLTPAAIARWMDAHPARTPVTTKALLRALRSACGYGVAQGYMHKSPFEFWKPSQWIRDDATTRGPRLQRHKSGDEIRRVLDQADAEAASGSWEAERLRALVYTYAFTGMRAAEAYHLLTANICLERRVLTIAPTIDWRPKTLKSAATLPLADELAEVLTVWLPKSVRPEFWPLWKPRKICPYVFPGKKMAGPWTCGGPGVSPLHQVKLLGERAGVPGLTCLTFRKTLGTLAKSFGFGPLELKAWLRHSNVQTQSWYDEEDVEVMRGTAGKIQFRSAR